MAFAVRGEYPAAAISLIAAIIFDIVDGQVAKRTPGRTAAQGAFGANLDSMADMACAGAALGVVVFAYGQFQAAYVAVAVLLSAATALRLSYFNVFGLDASSGAYTGLPADLAVLAFVALMLLDGPLGTATFRVVLAAGAAALAVLMVSPLRVRKLTGRWSVANVVVAVALALVHAARLVG
jgi:archaetidylserine synthase